MEYAAALAFIAVLIALVAQTGALNVKPALSAAFNRTAEELSTSSRPGGSDTSQGRPSGEGSN
jgi:Flp pilus assembly pilin Flp